MQLNQRSWAALVFLGLAVILGKIYSLVAGSITLIFFLKTISFVLESLVLYLLYKLVRLVRRRRLYLAKVSFTPVRAADSYQPNSPAWQATLQRPLGLLFGNANFQKDDLAIMYGYLLGLGLLAWLCYQQA